MMSVVGREKQGPVHVTQRPGTPPECAARVDILDDDHACRGTVALPQLVAVSSVITDEKQGTVDVRQVARIQAEVGSWVHVCKHESTGGSPVTLPELEPVVLGREKKGPIHVRQIRKAPRAR